MDIIQSFEGFSQKKKKKKPEEGQVYSLPDSWSGTSKFSCHWFCEFEALRAHFWLSWAFTWWQKIAEILSFNNHMSQYLIIVFFFAQIYVHMLWKWCTQYVRNTVNSAVATGLEKVSFHSNPKERQCQIMHKILHSSNMLVGAGNGTPLQYSCLENPMGGGAWWAAVHGIAKSQTGLSNFTFTFHFHSLEKEMATHSSVLAWRIPGAGEPGGLLSMGSHRVRHDWSDLATAAAATCW